MRPLKLGVYRQVHQCVRKPSKTEDACIVAVTESYKWIRSLLAILKDRFPLAGSKRGLQRAYFPISAISLIFIMKLVGGRMQGARYRSAPLKLSLVYFRLMRNVKLWCPSPLCPYAQSNVSTHKKSRQTRCSNKEVLILFSRNKKGRRCVLTGALLAP